MLRDEYAPAIETFVGEYARVSEGMPRDENTPVSKTTSVDEGILRDE